MVYRVFRGEEAIRNGRVDCDGKKRYTLKEARQTVNSLHQSGRLRRARIYQCGGDHWHIARTRE